jgi:magnesium transporter
VKNRLKLEAEAAETAAHFKQGRTQEGLRQMKKINRRKQVDVLRQLSPAERARLLPELHPRDAAYILQELSDNQARLTAEQMDRASLAPVLNAMELDEAADLLGDLGSRQAEELLAHLDQAEEVAGLMEYLDDTAGGRMTPEYLALDEQVRVEQAVQALREWQPRSDEVHYIFVTGEEERLTGVVGPFDLLRAGAEQTLGEIARRDILSVEVSEDQETAARLMLEHGLGALPVVNQGSELVGVITFATAMQTLEEEATEDIYQKGGIAGGDKEHARSEVMLSGSPWQTWRVRLPFLLVALIGGIGAGLVIDAFEEALAAVTALAIFIPIVMDMGGNAGVQSSTIFARGYVAGQVKAEDFLRNFLREVMIGAGLALFLGLLVGGIASVWQADVRVGITVGLALTLTVILAVSLGFIVPFVLIKLGFDQAAGSNPVITTIKDVTGLLIYFGLARLLLGV